MKRSTFFPLAAAALLAIGAVLYLTLLAPRYGLPPYGKPSPGPGPATSTPEASGTRNSALNLYLAAPAALPDGAVRAELTLIKASLVSSDGTSVAFFEGAQRVMLQEGAVQKTLSERIPDGRWTKLVLDFSPAAELAYANGDVKASLVDKKQAVFAFDAQLGVSRTLAVFGTLPVERSVASADAAVVSHLLPEARPAEIYVFGGFLLDPRGRGEIVMVDNPTMVSVIKKDLGFDLSVVKPGSTGFQPASGGPPAAQTPPSR